jgi:hypothetical protein
MVGAAAGGGASADRELERLVLLGEPEGGSLWQRLHMRFPMAGVTAAVVGSPLLIFPVLRAGMTGSVASRWWRSLAFAVAYGLTCLVAVRTVAPLGVQWRSGGATAAMLAASMVLVAAAGFADTATGNDYPLNYLCRECSSPGHDAAVVALPAVAALFATLVVNVVVPRVRVAAGHLVRGVGERDAPAVRWFAVLLMLMLMLSGLVEINSNTDSVSFIFFAAGMVWGPVLLADLARRDADELLNALSRAAYASLLALFVLGVPPGVGVAALSFFTEARGSAQLSLAVLAAYGVVMAYISWLFERSCLMVLRARYAFVLVFFIQFFDDVFSALIFVVVEDVDWGFALLVLFIMARNVLRDTGILRDALLRLFCLAPQGLVARGHALSRHWRLAAQNALSELLAALFVLSSLLVELSLHELGPAEDVLLPGVGWRGRRSLVLTYAVFIAAQSVAWTISRRVLTTRLRIHQSALVAQYSDARRAGNAPALDAAKEAISAWHGAFSPHDLDALLRWRRGHREKALAVEPTMRASSLGSSYGEAASQGEAQGLRDAHPSSSLELRPVSADQAASDPEAEPASEPADVEAIENDEDHNAVLVARMGAEWNARPELLVRGNLAAFRPYFFIVVLAICTQAALRVVLVKAKDFTEFDCSRPQPCR